MTALNERARSGSANCASAAQQEDAPWVETVGWDRDDRFSHGFGVGKEELARSEAKAAPVGGWHGIVRLSIGR
jgi:hypothetical protein